MNDRIRAPEVRLIDSDGAQLGVKPTRDARALAEERGLDLIEVAPNAEPPVCRIMDYGKYRYEKARREKEAHRKSHAASELKGIRIRPRTDDHDFGTKVKMAEKFLKQGHKVKITCQFRGREMAHQDIGLRQLDGMAKELEEVGHVEMRPSLSGRFLNMVIAPK
ncbi:MAG: translation initiation factor IF-3 [Armatimonadetes bacterium CG2_30_59_28]|nr:translation initiation factor IF-3 [Armatimonadota bacterium]OIO89816.1 MAG: translation initiation factor IF-3 [Armatimonadetes bacterium CG2_30_59_28]PIU65428.1 MAG: translation initiation factor IF-3 [Armatimonadetes bacterium CG07_land_8_20_14_0_80_59_28]PIX44357.1 MAG: translation initiation factor IF-3 [Armatimonadetes bacterium CG_4_8_14_3_um_filter_58_9]PIY44553.1 MAG: translation initiation factor IF-3 [Armatimonadetes bacterium CG_4_10_14_3_um_filter_59_10]PJB62268.1 MAG: translat